MGLFQRKRFVWNEPWFFQQRIRTTKAWVLFVLVLIVIGGGVGAALYFSAPAAKRIHWLGAIGLGTGVAACIWWVLDGANTRRQAVLLENSLVVGGDMGKYSSPVTYQLSKIAGAAIVTPEESKWPEPALYFHYEGNERAIGIESKASFARLAQAIHDLGIPIRLEGWQPNQESEFQKAFSWQVDPQQIAAKAQMEVLPPGTPSMMTVSGILVGIVRQLWAIVLWLLITGWVVYDGYRNWKNMGYLRMVLLFVIPIGTMYIAAQITDRFASASSSQGLVRMAKSQLRKRNGMPLDLDSAEVIPVEIFAPDQFDKRIQKMREMGFLQADTRGQQLLLEGKKERWRIPAASIQSLTIEEVQVGTPGESAMGGLTYYVVIQFTAEGTQTFGLRYGDRDYGEVDDVKRAQGAIRVFECIETVLSRA